MGSVMVAMMKTASPEGSGVLEFAACSEAVPVLHNLLRIYSCGVKGFWFVNNHMLCVRDCSGSSLLGCRCVD